MKLETYLINLDCRPKRLSRMSTILDKMNIRYTRISAFDGGNNINLAKVKQYTPNRAIKYMGRELSGGEVGCYMSHLESVRKFLQSEADYAMVLEDDIFIEEDIMPCIKIALEALEKSNLDWKLINIGCKKCKIRTPIAAIEKRYVFHAHYFPLSTMGLIWNKKGAEEFYKAGLREIFCPVDNYLRYWLTETDKGCAIYPPLVSNSLIGSDIKDFSNIKIMSSHKLIKQRRLFFDKFKALKHKYYG